MGSTLTIKANLAEYGQSLGVKEKQSVNKNLKLGPGSGVAKRLCFNCGSDRHRATDCRKPKE
ncbi:hypothetical protein CsSME_00019577 [Camellia sinensis var. sinensis]